MIINYLNNKYNRQNIYIKMIIKINLKIIIKINNYLISILENLILNLIIFQNNF